MKGTLIGLGFGLAILGGGGPPRPTETISPPAFNSGAAVLVCIAQNIGEQTVNVEATLRRPDGTIAGSAEADVQPGRTVEITSSAAPLGGAYCVFRFDGDPATVRGYIHQHPPGADTRALFPAFKVDPGPVEMTQTFTPPLRSLSGALSCRVQNLSGDTVEVESELVDEDGNVIDSSTDQVSAGTVLLTVTSALAHPNAYCRFTFEASAQEVRGYITLLNLTPNVHLVLPASPAEEVKSLVMYTPPVTSAAADATSCVVQNLGAAAIHANAELIDSTGTLLDTGDVIIQPDHVETVAGHTEAGSNAICRFVFEDTGDRARGFITRFPPQLFADGDLLEPAVAPRGMIESDVTTYSPPVRVEDNLMLCALENLSEDDVVVHVEIIDENGATIAENDIIAAGGRGQGTIGTFEDVTSGVCTFTFDGSPNHIRGFVALVDPVPMRTLLLFPAEPRGEPPPTATPTRTMQPTFTRTHSPTATAEPTSSPTPTSTATPTQTNTFTNTATQTPTHTETETPANTAMQTQTPTVPLPCLGDCNDDGAVTVDEILTMVNIALGAAIDDCPAGDRDGDEEITVDELIEAVTNALDGCPS